MLKMICLLLLFGRNSLSKARRERERQHTSCEVVGDSILVVVNRGDPIVGVGVADVEEVEELEAEGEFLDALPVAAAHELGVGGIPETGGTEIDAAVSRGTESAGRASGDGTGEGQTVVDHAAQVYLIGVISRPIVAEEDAEGRD